MKSLATLFLICISLGIISAQNRDQSPEYFFIQITDLQFGFIEANKGFGKETELYQKAVNIISRLKPAFVVITGDLVNNRSDRSQVNEFKRLTATIDKDIPVYILPGNHDIGESPVQADIDNFNSDYGNDRFSFKYKNSAFIGLNSCLIKSGTTVLEQQQFDWLGKELSKAEGSGHILIFCHYPFFVSAFDEPDEYFNIPGKIREKYLLLFKNEKVDAVFAGHLHKNSIAHYDGMQMVTTSAVGKPLAKDPSGIRIIKVYPDSIASVYYGLDEIPGLKFLK